MRYLNRIIFINSANIRYAVINLKGNVHFIGTQGVGKSTLLRAILFFYNADTLGLGIPRQKSSYVDYYFKNDNAYIIYEVVREDGKFCVLSYKSKHKVCFRFFDGAYKQDLLVNKDGKVAESWEDVATVLDQNGIYYTKRRIEEYKAYRDIIYGNIEGKRSENRRYSILESREYQNIPKTIQNVFLNSKMEADFIKQTIIMSLDNDVRIELNQYAHHLNGFESQLADIKRFKMPKSVAQADEISNLYVAINALEREKIQLAKELAYAVKKNDEALPILEEKLQTKSEKSQVVEQQIQVLNKNYREREVNLSGEIKFENKNITHARSLVKKYDEIDINTLITRVDAKNNLESRQHDLRQEQQLLLSKFASIDEKYKQLVAKLNNQLLAFEAAKQNDITKLKDAFYEFKDLINKQYDEFINDIRDDAENELATLNEVWEQKKQAVGGLKIEKAEIQHRRFFEEEIDGVKRKISYANDDNRSLKAAVESANAEIVNWQKQWGLELNKLENSTDNEKGKLADKIEKLELQYTEIEAYLDNSKSSLYGWLTENYPNWSQTIGKVIDEKSVLFNNDLSPKLTNEKGNLFGVEIDLTQIDKRVKTVKEYEAEKERLAYEIAESKEAIVRLDKQLEKQTENLKKRIQPTIKAAKDAIRKNKYELEQIELKLKEYHVALTNYATKATEEKSNVLTSVKVEIDKAAEAQLAAKYKIDQAQQSLQKLIKSKEAERAKNLKREKERLDQSIEAINAVIATEGEKINGRIAELEKEKAEELNAKGADTPRLKEIEKQLKGIAEELRFIENNRNTVTEYFKDKREFIDNTEQFKADKKKLENQLENAKIRYHNQLEKLTKELNELNGIITNLKAQVKETNDDLETWRDFTESELYEAIVSHLVNPNSTFNTQKTLKQIVDALRDIHYEKLNKRIESLKTTVAEFLGKFTEDNLFKFKKNLSDTASYLDFATMLRDFIEEQKIVRIEKEVNERFAWLVSTLTNQTNQLLTNSGSIQKVISKINRDFEEKNFAGVIKRIELKVDESRNEIVQLLVLIKKFNDENAMDLGQVNLFSSNDHEKQSKKAVDLLKQFVKKISELRKDDIALADSFELKFRVIENDNDSGWVEKLSNVGSEGTDVLVKAMLNIMLLNVFKEGASRRFRDFELHCMMDEIGKLHPNNVRGILNFAKDRNIHLISGSPIENDALAFDHIYKLSKDSKSITRVKRIISQYS